MKNKLNKLLLKDKKTYKVCILENTEKENEFLNETAKILKDSTDVIEFDGTKLNSKDYLSVAKKLRDLCGVFNALLIIKDRIDIAKLSNAEGIALDIHSIPPQEAHKLSEDILLLGYHVQCKNSQNENEHELLDFIVSDAPIKTNIKVFEI